MRCLSGSNFRFTSCLNTHRKVSTDHSSVFSYITSQALRFVHSKEDRMGWLPNAQQWACEKERERPFEIWWMNGGPSIFFFFFVQIKYLLFFQTTCLLMIFFGKGDSHNLINHYVIRLITTGTSKLIYVQAYFNVSHQSKDMKNIFYCCKWWRWIWRYMNILQIVTW